MIYRDNAPIYRARGWYRILPLPPGQKYPPPIGWTGAGAPEPTDTDIEELIKHLPDGNIALRMPDDVIGIDVDAYGNKHGADTFASAIERYGPLPATWFSTARGLDSESGIYLYRVPAGSRFPGKLEIDGHSDVEIIQARHRYMVAPPSVHPNGAIYAWYSPDGTTAKEGAIRLPPFVHELPELPAGWLEALTLSGEAVSKSGMNEAQAGLFLQGLPDADAEPCFTLKAKLHKATRALEDEGSRHDSAVRDTLSLLGLAVEGHRGGRTALERYGNEFVAAIGPDRGDRAAQGEYERMVQGAADILSRDLTVHPGEPCACDAAFEPRPLTAEQIANAYDVPPEMISDVTDPTEPTEDEIIQEVRKEKRRAEAKRRVAAEQSRLRLEVPKFTDAATFIAEADSNISWRIDNVIEKGATVGFFAAAKVGKSTVLGNLAHALLTGEPFLGEWETTRVDGSIVLVDMELSSNRLRAWLKKWGNGSSKLHIASLRGEAGNFNLENEMHLDRIAAELRVLNTEVLIIDPLGPLMRSIGIDENDPSEVGTLLDRFSTLKEAAGISEILVSHHAGHDNKDRPRGASTFMDWPDVLLLMRLKDKAGFGADAGLLTAPRVISAYGRDVDIPPIELIYNPDNGQVIAQTKAMANDALMTALINAVRLEPGISQSELRERLRADSHKFTNAELPALVKTAIKRGYIERTFSKRGNPTGLKTTTPESLTA